MDLTNNPLVANFEKVADVVADYKKEVTIALAAIVIGVIGFVGYRYYRASIERAAHEDLVVALNYFDTPVAKDPANKSKNLFGSQAEKWKEVAFRFNKAYEQNSSSSLAPMFLAYHSEALINLGEHAEAIRSLTEAVKRMPNVYLRGYFELKLKLLQMDSKDSAVVAQGVKGLQAIALNQKHSAHDQALYRLGQYQWINKKFKEAKSTWQQFMVKYGNEASLEPLVRDVRTKLNLVAV